MVGFSDNQILIYGFYNKEDLQAEAREHSEAEGLSKKAK
jgi:hypothetical protein